MHPGEDIVDFINYIGEKIESSGLPPWVQFIFIVLLVVVVIYTLGSRFWGIAKLAEDKFQSDQPNPDLLAYAMSYKILEDNIKNEKDPKKKAILIKERDEALKKLQTI